MSSLIGTFTIVEAKGPKAYDFDGKQGVSQKVVLRSDVGADREVKAGVECDFSKFLGESVEIEFSIEKGGFIKAISVVE